MIIRPHTNFVVVWAHYDQVWSITYRLRCGKLETYNPATDSYEPDPPMTEYIWENPPQGTRFYSLTHEIPIEITNVTQAIIHNDRVQLITERQDA
jgi:hypothetical protein